MSRHTSPRHAPLLRPSTISAVVSIRYARVGEKIGQPPDEATTEPELAQVSTEDVQVPWSEEGGSAGLVASGFADGCRRAELPPAALIGGARVEALG
jgi:hypothetical protein